MASSGFFLICLLHSVIALTSGLLTIFYSAETMEFSHGFETARKFQGSTPHDQLLVQYVSKLEMFVDELPDIPRIHGYKFVHGVPKPKSLRIGMFDKKWV